MTAREIALRDIKEELKQESRSFISFRTELNPAISQIVKDYSKIQEENGKA